MGIHFLDSIRKDIKAEFLSEYYNSQKEVHVPTSYEDKVFWDLPMVNISALGLYGAGYDYWIEDEFLARVYSMMAVNPCITFVDDIWSVMKEVSPEIGNSIIPIDIAREIDTEMRVKMKLNKRTYNMGFHEEL